MVNSGTCRIQYQWRMSVPNRRTASTPEPVVARQVAIPMARKKKVARWLRRQFGLTDGEARLVVAAANGKRRQAAAIGADLARVVRPLSES
jgi:hypothetical protein